MPGKTPKPPSPVCKDDIVFRAKPRDAELLARYAQKNGLAALPFLRDALARGNTVLRCAAAEAMRGLDPQGAEQQVLAMRAALAGKATLKATSEREALLKVLLWLATPSSIGAFLAEDGKVTEFRGDRDFDAFAVDTALVGHFVERGMSLDGNTLRDQLQRAFGMRASRRSWSHHEEAGPSTNPRRAGSCCASTTRRRCDGGARWPMVRCSTWRCATRATTSGWSVTARPRRHRPCPACARWPGRPTPACGAPMAASGSERHALPQHGPQNQGGASP